MKNKKLSCFKEMIGLEEGCLVVKTSLIERDVLLIRPNSNNLIMLRKEKSINMRPIIKILSVCFLVVLISSTCGSRSNKANSEISDQTEEISLNNPSGYGKSFQNPPLVIEPTFTPAISKVLLFIENSGSMSGYVNGNTDFKQALVALAYHAKFINTEKEFFFINGKSPNVRITSLGNDAGTFHNNLTVSGFRAGDPRFSDLPSMFEIAIDKAKGNNISILVSDAIFDIVETGNCEIALQTEVSRTRENIIRKLQRQDFQTIMIKLNSNFNGRYFFPCTNNKNVRINQSRPYYIWIFGNSDVLNKNFKNADFASSLNGYQNIAHFIKSASINLPYRIAPGKTIGEARPIPTDPNKLVRAKMRRGFKYFQFSFIVDYETLPFDDVFLRNIRNYQSSSGSWDVVDVIPQSPVIIAGFSPVRKFEVVVRSKNAFPFSNSKFSISLNNALPNWIVRSHTNDDRNIVNDTLTTFGLQDLTSAISGAYRHINNGNKIFEFSFIITQSNN